jgi:WD40 repeat protein
MKKESLFFIICLIVLLISLTGCSSVSEVNGPNEDENTIISTDLNPTNDIHEQTTNEIDSMDSNQKINKITSSNVNKIKPWKIIGWGEINDITFSHDGQHIAAGTNIGVFIFDGKILKQEKYLKTENPVMNVDYSPDGVILAASFYDDERIFLWKTEQYEHFKVLGEKSDDKQDCRLVFSPNGDKLAVSKGRRIEIWDTEDWALGEILETNMTTSRTNTNLVVLRVFFWTLFKGFKLGDSIYIIP